MFISWYQSEALSLSSRSPLSRRMRHDKCEKMVAGETSKVLGRKRGAIVIYEMNAASHAP